MASKVKKFLRTFRDGYIEMARDVSLGQFILLNLLFGAIIAVILTVVWMLFHFLPMFATILTVVVVTLAILHWRLNSA